MTVPHRVAPDPGTDERGHWTGGGGSEEVLLVRYLGTEGTVTTSLCG